MKHNPDLTEKVAVITGAGSGIGLALAACAAQRGMKLALIDQDEKGLAAALKQLRNHGARMMATCADISDLRETRKLARWIERELGPPWLVCNHGEASIELNLRSVIHGVQVFAPVLASRGQGHIVNIISAHRCSAACSAVYAAARHAMVGVSTSLYRELDCMGSLVGVSLVCHARMNWHSSILSPERRIGARQRATAPPNAKRLAQEIFAAVNTRRFWLFCDKSETDSSEPLAVREQPACDTAILRSSPPEAYCPVRRRRLQREADRSDGAPGPWALRCRGKIPSPLLLS